MEKREASHTVVECKLEATMENLRRFIKKLKTEPLYDLPIPLLGIYSEKMKGEVKVLVA